MPSTVTEQRMPTDARPAEPLLIPDTVAAALAGVSRATWWRLHAAAKTPRAIKLGRSAMGSCRGSRLDRRGALTGGPGRRCRPRKVTAGG